MVASLALAATALLGLTATASAAAASDDVTGRVAELRAKGADVKELELRMKAARVTQNDQYSCHQYDAPGGDAKNYAVAFEGLEEAFGGKVHHMLLFGCDGPKNYDKNFACGMSAGPCRGLPRQTFLFGWAKDAPGIALPDHGAPACPPARLRLLAFPAARLPTFPPSRLPLLAARRRRLSS